MYIVTNLSNGNKSDLILVDTASCALVYPGDQNFVVEFNIDIY